MLCNDYLLSAWQPHLAAINGSAACLRCCWSSCRRCVRGDQAQAAAMLRDIGPACARHLADLFRAAGHHGNLQSVGARRYIQFGNAVALRHLAVRCRVAGVFGVILPALRTIILVHAPPSQFPITHGQRKRS